MGDESVDLEVELAELKKRSNIMEAGKAADLAPDFSERIRAHIEGYARGESATAFPKTTRSR